MCVAIVSKPGAVLPIEKLDEGARCNKDGAGYAYVENGVVHVRRSLKWSSIREMFRRDYTRVGAVSPFLIHFRIATHGTVSKSNCHPFRLNDGGVFIHNGVIQIDEIPNTWSDTKHFVTNVLNTLPEGWQYSRMWCNIVRRLIDPGKGVAMWPNGAFVIFGEHKGHWESEDGERTSIATREQVWYSNYSCNLPKAPAAQAAPPSSGTTTPTGPTTTGGQHGQSSTTSTPPANGTPGRVPGTRIDHNPGPGNEQKQLPSPSGREDDPRTGFRDPRVWVQSSVGKWRRRTMYERQEYDKLVISEDFEAIMIDAGVCPKCGIVSQSGMWGTRAHMKNQCKYKDESDTVTLSESEMVRRIEEQNMMHIDKRVLQRNFPRAFEER